MPEPLFDQQIGNEAGQFLTDLLLRHPELRSVAIVCDFEGPLSKAAGLQRVTWKGEIKPDSVVGMMRVTNGFQEHLIGVSQKIVEGIEQKILEVGNRYLQQVQEPPTSPTATDGHGSQLLAKARETPPNVESQPNGKTGQGSREMPS